MGKEDEYRERSPLNRENNVSITSLLRAKHSPSHESLYVCTPGPRHYPYPPNANHSHLKGPHEDDKPYFTENNSDQPLDFSKKRNDVPAVASQRLFSTQILSPPSPAQPEPPRQILSTVTMDKYQQNVCQNPPSSPSEQSGDDVSYHNGSEPDQSPVQRRSISDVPLPGMPCVSQLGAFGLSNFYRDFRPNPLSQEGLLDQNALNTAGLLTTVQSLPISSTMPLRNDISPPNQSARNKSQKYARPFKAYPRDPLSAAVSMGLYSNFALPSAIPLSPEAMTTHNILSSVTDPAYLHFRQTMLENKRIDAKRKHAGLKSNGSSENLSNSQHGNSDGESNEACNNMAFAQQPQVVINCTRMPQSDELSNAGSDDKMCNTVGTSTGSPAEDNGHNSNNGHTHGAMAIQGISAPGLQQLPNTPTNRKRNRSLPEELKDEAYWERRRKNNEAAKRSRDARRAKEDEIAIRAAYLERENLKLRVELAALRNETNKLRSMVPVQVFSN